MKSKSNQKQAKWALPLMASVFVAAFGAVVALGSGLHLFQASNGLEAQAAQSEQAKTAYPASTLLTSEQWATSLQYFQTGPFMSQDLTYIFFDPMCPHCGKVWSALANSSHRIRWVPVAFLGRNSLNQAQHLLADQTQAAALMTNYKALAVSGHPAIVGPVSKELETAVMKNSQALAAMKVDGVPAIFYFKDQNNAKDPAKHIGEISADGFESFIKYGK